MGCLFAMFGGLFPRLALLIVWIARLPSSGRRSTPSSSRSWHHLPPLRDTHLRDRLHAGVGLVGFDWFWVILAVMLDIGHWGPATPAQPDPGG